MLDTPGLPGGTAGAWQGSGSTPVSPIPILGSIQACLCKGVPRGSAGTEGEAANVLCNSLAGSLHAQKLIPDLTPATAPTLQQGHSPALLSTGVLGDIPHCHTGTGTFQGHSTCCQTPLHLCCTFFGFFPGEEYLEWAGA